MEMPPRILILVGSASDLPTMRAATDVLDQFGVGYELHVSSAHRAPDRTADFARTARANGFGAIIAAAGLAAHLPGVVASFTTLPVIGVPLAGGALNGQDALLAIVQMPKGIPVATVAIDGAANAALLAIQVLAGAHEGLVDQLERFRGEQTAAVIAHDDQLQAASVPPGNGVPALTT
jgi:5-(carboxyamino)imidazole ribonucleotide mutase